MGNRRRFSCEDILMSRYEKIELPKKPITATEFRKYALGDGLIQTQTKDDCITTKTLRIMNDGGIYFITRSKTKNENGKWKESIDYDSAWIQTDENINHLLKLFVNPNVDKKGVKTFGSILVEDLHGFQTSTPRRRAAPKKCTPAVRVNVRKMF